MMFTSASLLPAAVLLVATFQQGIASAGTPHTEVTAPKPAIGALSSVANPVDHECTASIVSSPKGNIIVTAAHCVAGKKTVYFTPAYQEGKAPYGTWTSSSIHIDAGWSKEHNINTGSPYDYAFVVLEPRDGKNVAQVTRSSLTLDTSAALPAKVQVFGYPSKNKKYKDTSYVCDSTASKEGEFWEILQCIGIPDGYSGGPWIVDGKDVIGVIGGMGQSLPDTDPRNYSVRFDSRVKALYEQAVAAAARRRRSTRGAMGAAPEVRAEIEAEIEAEEP